MWRCRVGMARRHRSHALRVLDNTRDNARIHDHYGRAVYTGTAARTRLATVGRGRLVLGRGCLAGIFSLVMLVAGHLCCRDRYGRGDHGSRDQVPCMHSSLRRLNPV